VPVAVLAAADVPGATDSGPLPPLLAQIPMTVRLQLLAERFARLRRQDPDVAITGEWDAPALWQMGTPGAAP
jgi:glucosamine--fructose-6-phosphate aminotransferase (isomerizing)